MAKFKQRPTAPITVDAVQWKDGKISEVTTWIKEAMDKSMMEDSSGAIMRVSNDIHINTPRGILIAVNGDWLVKAGDLITPMPDVNFKNCFEPLDLETEKIVLKEYILCAANLYNDGKKHEHQPININRGFVVCGRRHHNCISTFAQIVGFPYSELGQRIQNTEEQGFLTNTNRFVTRKEAYKIAFESDQIKGPNQGYSENSIGLTSEDLY